MMEIPMTEAASQSTQPAHGLDPRLLEILVCPVTKESLLYLPERQELVSRAARLAYPIRDGIPVMLEDEARALTDDEVRTFGKR
jgi:uncharacterized protein YbaR (Trm112 family)